MKSKTTKLFSILLALVMVVGLLPLRQVVYAAGYTEIGQIEEVRATTNFKTPTLGTTASSAKPIFNLTTPTDKGVSIPVQSTYWKKKNTDGTWSAYLSSSPFVEGTYRLHVHVETDAFSDGSYYNFTATTKLYVNGTEWNRLDSTVHVSEGEDWEGPYYKHIIYFISEEYDAVEPFKFTTQPSSGTSKKTDTYDITWQTNTPAESMVLQIWNPNTNAWDGLANITGYSSYPVSYDSNYCNGDISKYMIICHKYGYRVDSNEFTVTWTDGDPTTHTVTFDPGEGSGTPFTQTVNAGEKLTLPSCSFTAPENKVFDKWDKGEPNEQIDVSGDMTVTALWKAATSYTVTVNNDGNGTASASPTSGPDGTVVTLTATPNPGYKFKEWTRQAGMLSGGLDVPNATSATTTFTISGYNVVVTATFEEDSATTHTVTFEPGEGSGTPFTQTVNAGEKLTLPSCSFTAPENKVFDKWDKGEPNEQIDVSGDMTVTALWKDATSYSVTVNNDGNGTASASPSSGPDGTVVTLTATPNPGYKFKEWTRQAGMLSGGLDVPNATSATTTFTISGYNVVVTATFEEDTSTVKPTITTTTLPNGKVGDAYNQTLAATGNTPITWSLESGNLPDGLTLATDGKISGTPTTPGDYTFTVKATNGAGNATKRFTVTIAPADAVTYTVSFNANSGGGTMADVIVIAGEKLTLPECTFTPPSADKEFDKWDAGNPGDKVDITSDCTITAIWKDKTAVPTTYTVTFKDGENTLSTATVNSGEKVTKPADPTKTGYTFNGWYADATFTAAFDFDQAITANTTVYAKFTENSVTPPGPTTYTVTFKDGENTLSTVTVNNGEKVAKPANPTKAGYTFNGWYADATFGVVFDFDQAITANTTVYAKFTDNSVTPPATITYTVTGGGNSTWTKGSSAAVTITVKRSEDDANCIKHFQAVEIDGTALAASDYEAKSGSTVVTIKAAALEKLSAGKHTVTVKFDDGSVGTSLTVKAASGGSEKPTSPKTGDESNMGLWMALAALSMAGFAGIAIVGRKGKAHR